MDELARRGLQQFVPLLGVVLLGASLLNMGRDNAQEVSFQWFKTQLLAKGVVERLEVANKQTVKVFVRPGALRRPGSGAEAGEGEPQGYGGGMEGGSGVYGAAAAGAGGGKGVYSFFFNIGSVDAFEHAMEDAQEALGLSPDAFIPITYTNEVSWQQELWRLLPTLLLIGGYVWFTRRQLGGLGGACGRLCMEGVCARRMVWCVWCALACTCTLRSVCGGEGFGRGGGRHLCLCEVRRSNCGCSTYCTI
jgi:AFG3 family protein